MLFYNVGVPESRMSSFSKGETWPMFYVSVC